MRKQIPEHRIRRYSKNYWQILSKNPDLWHDNKSRAIDFVYGDYEDALAELFRHLELLRRVARIP